MGADQGRAGHARSVVRIGAIVVAMFGFGYLLVPLYNVFCDITGVNGRSGALEEATTTAQFKPDPTRTVTVQFVANNNVAMPWKFQPGLATMKVHPGQLYATYFVAANPTDHKMVSQAVPSIAPAKAARYFNKTECFCFSQQPLAAHEEKQMPLRFIVDPRLPKDVKTLTLAYTLFDVTSQTAAK